MMKKAVISLLFFPFAFAQEFEPVVTEPLQRISWVKVLFFLLVVCGIIYWWKKHKEKEISKKKKKEEEGIKWIGKPKLNYQWIIIGLLLFIILYQWFPREGIHLFLTQLQVSPVQDHSQRQGEKEQPPMIGEEDIILEESIEIPPESPTEVLPKQETTHGISSPEVYSPVISISSPQSAEKELEDAKRAVADLFKAMTNANRVGKDSKEARIAYGEANQLYYRAYLALNNGRDADSIDLSHKAKEKAQKGMAYLLR